MDKTINMPSKDETKSEYQAATAGTALRRADAYGRLQISGSDHLSFLHRMTTNDFNSLGHGYGIEAVFTENRGRILDCGTFYHRDGNTLMMLSPSARATIPAWLDRYIFTERIDLLDLTDKTAMFELIGPQAVSLVRQVLGSNIAGLQPHQLLTVTPSDDLWLCALPWAGHSGLRAIGPTSAIAELQQLFFEAGAHIISEDVWEVLRVESGIPLYGSELNEEHNPWEAGLQRTIHMDKGCYIGQEVIARLDTYDKIKQHLIGLKFTEESPPTPGTELKSDGHSAGSITSSALSPTFGPIALAYVRRSYCEPGTALQTADGAHSGQVSPLPFR
ncbi:MAG: folate-binding protein YgfZ [Candidatus Latescibacterota bacterium]|jgi:folate-binding protein YgfZ